MNGRLVFAIVSTIAEEAAIAALFLLGLPWLGVRIPAWSLAIIMVVWAGYSIATYRMGSQALQKSHVIGLESMVGSRGEAVSPLAPEGMVKIKGELWKARSQTGNIEAGKEVVVVSQDGLKLVVREGEKADSKSPSP